MRYLFVKTFILTLGLSTFSFANGLADSNHAKLQLASTSNIVDDGGSLKFSSPNANAPAQGRPQVGSQPPQQRPPSMNNVPPPSQSVAPNSQQPGMPAPPVNAPPSGGFDPNNPSEENLRELYNALSAAGGLPPGMDKFDKEQMLEYYKKNLLQ